MTIEAGEQTQRHFFVSDGNNICSAYLSHVSVVKCHTEGLDMV